MKAAATALARLDGSGFVRRIPVATVVYAARILAACPPFRIRRILEALSRGARPSRREEAEIAHRAVLRASLMCAGDGCLPRSIAVALWCRLHGHWPTWHTGVQVHPFRAHAWVETDGVAIGESGDMSRWQRQMTVSVRKGGADVGAAVE